MSIYPSQEVAEAQAQAMAREDPLGVSMLGAAFLFRTPEDSDLRKREPLKVGRDLIALNLMGILNIELGEIGDMRVCRGPRGWKVEE